jgi:5-methylcytosine-specific restriction endonuclease McrA
MKALLLNSAYEGISFVPMKKALKLIFNDKVEIISEWDEEITWTNGKMNLPAVLRLKRYVRWIPKKIRFSKINVFRRDKCMCCYCGVHFKVDELTLDHIQPRSKGGQNHFLNVVSSCRKCNFKKGNKTLAEAGMVLLKNPTIPTDSMIHIYYDYTNPKHHSWLDFLGYK